MEAGIKGDPVIRRRNFHFIDIVQHLRKILVLSAQDILFQFRLDFLPCVCDCQVKQVCVIQGVPLSKQRQHIVSDIVVRIELDAVFFVFFIAEAESFGRQVLPYSMEHLIQRIPIGRQIDHC